MFQTQDSIKDSSHTGAATVRKSLGGTTNTISHRGCAAKRRQVSAGHPETAEEAS